MIRPALWGVFALLCLPVPAAAGSAACVWDNLSAPSRDLILSQYKDDGTVTDEDFPPEEEFERAAAACGYGTADDAKAFIGAAAGAIGVKKAAAARLRSLGGIEEARLESHWWALSSKQRELAEDYLLAKFSDTPPAEGDPRLLLLMSLYVLAGWTTEPDDPLLSHYVNYYAGLVSASGYEKQF